MIRYAALLSLLALPAAAQEVQMINPAGLSKPPNTYSHIARAGKLIFIAGQLGRTADGKLVGPGMKEQTEQVYKNLDIALKSQGATFADVTRLTIYVTNMEEFRTPEINALRLPYVSKAPPPTTLMQVAALASPEYKVEIEVTAVLP